MSDNFKQAISDAEKLLANLEAKHAEAQADVKAIAERRRPLALAAELGDVVARKGLVRLADEEKAAELRARDLAFAIESQRQQLDAAKARSAAADREAREAIYAEHAVAAVAAAVAMDEAARALTAARGRLVAAHAGMAGTQVANSATLNRLLFRASLTKCLVKHGLAEFTELPRIASPTLLPTFEDLVAGVVGAAASTKQREAA